MDSEVELTRLLGTRFVQRKDVKAFQKDNGEWYPARDFNTGADLPMTQQDFRDHFKGTKTMGHYLVDRSGYCKLFAFDIDLVKHNRDCAGNSCKGCPVPIMGMDGILYEGIPREVWGPEGPVTPVLTTHLRCMAEGLAIRINRELQISTSIATSGHKGLHVYGFTGTMPAESVREVAVGILERFGCFEPFRGQNFWRHKSEYHTLDIEVFPKQGSLDGKEYGNLMALPLGVHRVTGKRKDFITCKARYDRLIPMNPTDALNGDLPWE